MSIQEQILDLLKQKGVLSLEDIKTELNLKKKPTSSLNSMIRKGLVKNVEDNMFSVEDAIVEEGDCSNTSVDFSNYSSIVIKGYKFLCDRLENQKSITGGGLLRQYSGETVEKFVDYVFDLLLGEHPNVKAKIEIGSNTPVEVFSKNGFSIEESVDRHIFIDGKIVCGIECKTYLDKCYCQRANSDFDLMKKGVNFSSCILSLEDGIASDSLNFFLDGSSIDKNFFLSSGKRSSAESNRIYNTYNTRLKIELINDFIKYLEGFFNENSK